MVTHLVSPLPDFPLFFHPRVETALRELLTHLRSNAAVESWRFRDLIHQAIWLILQCPSEQYQRDELQCLFTRFLVAFHVQEDSSFSNAKLITPGIAAVEWCFRATAVEETLRRADEFEQNADKAFHACVETWISESQPCLFNSLRQTMHFFTTLAFSQQGLSRFMWSKDRRTLSMDGFPVHIPSFIKEVGNVLSTVAVGIEKLFRGCEYLDILDHIDRSMVPELSGRPRWFLDRISERRHLYSFLEEEQNGLKGFRPRLLRYLAEKSELFRWVDNKLVLMRRK